MPLTRTVSTSMVRLPSPVAWCVIMMTLTLVACADPCAELEVKLCDVLQEEQRCELIEDEQRRAMLTRDTCQSVLDKLNRR